MKRGIAWVPVALAVITLVRFLMPPAGEPARPALWRVEGAGGHALYLFGTIHALPRPTRWQTPAVEQAFAGSDTLVVEIAGLNNDAANAAVFAQMARADGLPPLAERLPPAQRPAQDPLRQVAPARVSGA